MTTFSKRTALITMACLLAAVSFTLADTDKKSREPYVPDISTFLLFCAG